MKKIKNIICTLLAVISLSTLLAGCGNNLEKKIVGKWQDPDAETQTVEFFEDGTCLLSYSSGEATYTIDSEKGLKITAFLMEPKYYVYVSPNEITTTEEDRFWSIDGDKLYLNNADNYYVKQ